MSFIKIGDVETLVVLPNDDDEDEVFDNEKTKKALKDMKENVVKESKDESVKSTENSKSN